MKHLTSFVVLGDVVGSRQAADRRALHQSLSAVLGTANERFGTDLRITVGDEYQGHCDSLGTALALTWWVRLHLLPGIDVRHGIGVGQTQPVGDGVEDGPGWWAAREAIEAVEAAATRPRSRAQRDRLAVAPDTDLVPAPLAAAVTAALAGRDVLTHQLDARDVSVVRGLLDGQTQVELAESLGVSSSAVSQRIRSRGLAVLLEITDELATL